MARLQGSHPNLLRLKAGLTADADYTDPSVAIPGYAGTAGSLLSSDPALAKAWAVVPRRSDGSVLTKVKIKVTFRTAATGAEVAGTFSSTTFAVVPRHELEGKGTSRPAVEWLGAVVDQPSMKPIIVDVAAFDAMGLIFTAITAVGADQVFVYVQEWL
jgi:hypothetical protein